MLNGMSTMIMAGIYKKSELLGSGAFGKAWLVIKGETSKTHVMKEILVKGLTEKEKNQALTEVEVLAKCKHLNIVRYKDAFIDDGALNIVMEYAENGDLQKKIDTQNGIFFQEKVILDWFVQICFGLKYIHGLNILHRDLKTQNIFLNQDNIVKIGDFGISKMLQTAEDYANTTIGTPFYLSPEICEKKPYNSKSDMWALGCVLYNLCSLHHPFEAPDFASLMVKIVQAQYRPLPMPYVNAYVKKSLAVRQHRIGSASPMVKHMYEKRRSSSPKPARTLSCDQKRPETPQRGRSAKEYESPDENKENIDPHSGERSIGNRPAWGTPRPGGLKNICQNIQSAEPTARSSRQTPAGGQSSPRFSLQREVFKRQRLHSDSPKRLSDSPPLSPRSNKGSPISKKTNLTPIRSKDIKASPSKVGKAAYPNESPSKISLNLKAKTRKSTGKMVDVKALKSERRKPKNRESTPLKLKTEDDSNCKNNNIASPLETRADQGSAVDLKASPLAASYALSAVYKSLVSTPKDLQKAIHTAQRHLEIHISKEELQEVCAQLKDSLGRGKKFHEYCQGLEPSLIKFMPLIMHLYQLKQFADFGTQVGV